MVTRSHRGGKPQAAAIRADKGGRTLKLMSAPTALAGAQLSGARYANPSPDRKPKSAERRIPDSLLRCDAGSASKPQSKGSCRNRGHCSETGKPFSNPPASRLHRPSLTRARRGTGPTSQTKWLPPTLVLDRLGDLRDVGQKAKAIEKSKHCESDVCDCDAAASVLSYHPAARETASALRCLRILRSLFPKCYCGLSGGLTNLRPLGPTPLTCRTASSLISM